MLIDFESEFADLLITYDGIRYGQSSKDADGRAIAGAGTPFEVKATYPQPAGQNDFRLLPEGSTPSSALVIHATERLVITQGGKKGDVIIWQGEQYFVMQVNERNNLGGHYRTLIRKVQAGE